MLQSSTLKFLKDLSKNNNKPWFEAHRKQYEAAKNDFAGFMQSIIDAHGKKDPVNCSSEGKGLYVPDQPDVGFQKINHPIKTIWEPIINKGGKKSVFGGYYFHCQPGQSFVGGGLWMPMPPELSKVRQEIDYNFDAFKKIITSKKFKTVYNDLSKDAEYILTRLPKGYETDNPAAEYLKLKSFVAMVSLKDTELTSKDLSKKVLAAFEALHPMLEFINQSIEG